MRYTAEQRNKKTETNKLSIEELDEVKTMLAERVKEWNRESMERGIQKGALNLLVRQLETKFGPIAPEVMKRLEQTNEQQLLNWSERILSAEKPSDIFGN